jgi:hypothetical protein
MHPFAWQRFCPVAFRLTPLNDAGFFMLSPRIQFRKLRRCSHRSISSQKERNVPRRERSAQTIGQNVANWERVERLYIATRFKLPVRFPQTIEHPNPIALRWFGPTYLVPSSNMTLLLLGPSSISPLSRAVISISR